MSLDSAFISILNSQLSTPFDAIGVAAIGPIEDEMRHLELWLEKGYAGDMKYMHNNLHLRANPKELLPEARSMIMVLMNYYPRRWQSADKPQIAAYAYGNDYHHIVKSKLSQLAEEINKVAPHSYAVFCDSAPVLERYWAMRAGLGWIGRNGMLVNPRLGTFTFIGTLITSLDLEPNKEMENRCGTCRRCVDACPTNAILNKTIDARRCLSYQTIEKRGDIDNELIEVAKNTLYGCDRCQLACPWNRFAHPHNHLELEPIEEIFELDWASMSRSEFNRKLKFSPMQRAGLKKIKARYEQIIHKSYI
ncbi:MAG: tRNA epoxyqueuosine(34) reductase QueG [Paludibacteraceae bacterium]|nr:tRNA epoxyqueuosine(34) reductase QueG [Paludibacteraceae bacterium]